MRILLVAIVLLCYWPTICQAFVSLRNRPGSRGLVTCRLPSVERTVLFGTRDDSKEDEDDSDMDIERERQRLESLLGTTSGGPSNGTIATAAADKPDLLSLPIEEWTKQVRNPPLLTSIGRERMEMEITLLESLAVSDDAIPEMWNLWYNFRGPGPAKDLMQTEALVAKGQPEAWAQAEDLLRKLIAREGIHWVEPVNRLATLMFLQSRHEESKELCELVLQLKPWHFGALSGMVMVQQGLQNHEGMLDYARQRMPPLPRKGEEPKQPPPELEEELETRQQWVDRMLDRAKAMLLRQEMGLEESFLDLDKKQKEGGPSTTNTNKAEETKQDEDSKNKPATEVEDDEDDAWQ